MIPIHQTQKYADRCRTETQSAIVRNPYLKGRTRILLLALLLCATGSLAQTPAKGVYSAYRTPYMLCYLTYTDSVMEVEYFYAKGGQIFSHLPARRLLVAAGSTPEKPVFVSTDDSIQVISKRDYFLVKPKHGLGSVVNAKVRKHYEPERGRQIIDSLRDSHSAFRKRIDAFPQ